MIAVKNVSKTYSTPQAKVQALQDVSLEIEAGDIFGIIGFSGAGKSTLVRCLNRLEEPDAGSITIDGQEITSLDKGRLRLARRKIGMIFQQFNLLDAKTVFENIAFPLEVSGYPKAQIRGRVEEILELVGLQDKANAYPSQLSGGQKQRVALARAFASHPDLLLMDEPFSALDTLTAETSRNLFIDLWKKHRPTTILTTHNLAEAVTLGKYILLLRKLPATVYHWIENPLFDSNGQHSEEEFYRFVRELSDLLRSSNNNPIEAYG